MGQSEVLDFLNNKRAITEDFFTVRQIQKGLQSEGYGNGVIKTVHKAVAKLVLFSVIEWKGKGIWKHHKEFRAKGKAK